MTISTLIGTMLSKTMSTLWRKKALVVFPCSRRQVLSYHRLRVDGTCPYKEICRA